MSLRFSCAALLLSAALFACVSGSGPGSGSASSDAGTEVVRIPVTIDAESGSLTFQAEIADTPEEEQRGLMFRTSMGEKEGMIFLFPRPQQQRFWMKNTLIPLDMLFIKADRTILGIVENAEPKTETGRMVPGESQFVLELNGGTSAKLGIKAGQTVSFYAPIPTK